jgi:hypothetical protein
MSHTAHISNRSITQRLVCTSPSTHTGPRIPPNRVLRFSVIIIDEFGDGRPDQYQRPDAAQPAFVFTIPGLNLIAEIANSDLFGRSFCAVSNLLALTDFRERFGMRNYISNRFWVKNRSYRKQTTKPPLTGSRIAFKGFSKIAALPRENQPEFPSCVLK